MLLPEFSVIRLRTDRYLSEGVGGGAIGVILEVGELGYITEFSRPDGTTIALMFLEPEDVELAPEFMTTTADRSKV
jgi:hypothetical protein